LAAGLRLAAMAETNSSAVEPVPFCLPASKLVYVAIGDSYSSGEGVPHFIGASKCHRSEHAYAELLAKRLRIVPSKMQFRACSGAQIADILWKVKNNEPPQIDGLNSTTTLITLSIGGNDIGFAPIAVKCIFRNCVRYFEEGDTDQVSERIAALRQGLDLLYSELRKRAPNAAILVVGYPLLFSQDSHGAPLCSGISHSEQRWLNAKGSELDSAIRDEVATADKVSALDPPIRYVDVEFAFLSGAACTGRGSFVNGLRVRHHVYSFHPNMTGQDVLAKKVLDELELVDSAIEVHDSDLGIDDI
jgi:lysophospholipase L1-like esterase